MKFSQISNKNFFAFDMVFFVLHEQFLLFSYIKPYFQLVLLAQIVIIKNVLKYCKKNLKICITSVQALLNEGM